MGRVSVSVLRLPGEPVGSLVDNVRVCLRGTNLCFEVFKQVGSPTSVTRGVGQGKCYGAKNRVRSLVNVHVTLCFSSSISLYRGVVRGCCAVGGVSGASVRPSGFSPRELGLMYYVPSSVTSRFSSLL